MAQNKNEVASTPTTYSVQEIRQKQADYDRRIELFKTAQEAIKFLDLSKTETRSYTTFDKGKLRTYLRNPMANEKNIRNLSRFLYRVSMPYRRLVHHNVVQMDLTAMSIIPLVDMTKNVNAKKVLKNYYATCKEVEKDNLQGEIDKILTTAWVEDAVHCYLYEDDYGMYLMILDGDYCKISSTNYDGSFNTAFDFTYFRSHPDLLEFWDSEFKQKYDAYQLDNTLRWQELDPSRTMCLKVHPDDPKLCLPYYLPMFEAMIDNIDLQSIQNVKDNLQIYKLLVARLETIKGSNNPDDFTIDPKLAIEYYNKCVAELPNEVSMVLSPMPIDAIDFAGNTTDDVDMIANSTSNLFKVAGGSLILDNTKSGNIIYRAQQIEDMLVGLRPLLPQVEVWMNRHLTYVLGDHAKVRYMMTSPWLKNEKKAELLQSATSGVPVKLALAALDGFSPLETMSMEFLENDILELHKKWIPLNISYTQSGIADTTTADPKNTDDSDIENEVDQTERKKNLD